MRPIVTLTTDFGLHDAYVGAMKGVILGIAPDAQVVDICHEAPPQDIVAGALLLEAAFHLFPPGSVHVAVVDPGVGSERAAVAVETARYRFVAPDNGLLTLALVREEARAAVRLTNPAYYHHPVSATFHGRDIFAPAAAHLAAGVPLAALGEPMSALTPLDLPQTQEQDGSLALRVLAADRFGNLITNLTADAYAEWRGPRADSDVALAIAGRRIHGIRRTFADVPPADLVAYFGSGGRLELAVRNGSAATLLAVGPGAALLLEPTA